MTFLHNPNIKSSLLTNLLFISSSIYFNFKPKTFILLLIPYPVSAVSLPKFNIGFLL